IAPVVDVPDAVPMPAPVVAPPAVLDRTPLIASAWPLGSRVQAVEGERAMVVTSHQLASDVGLDVLRRGGNAVDAAVAVALALAAVPAVAGNMRAGGVKIAPMRDGPGGAVDLPDVS